jgi:hypothetical protein
MIRSPNLAHALFMSTLVVGLTTLGCGGKILDDGSLPGGSSGSTAGAPTSSQGGPSGTATPPATSPGGPGGPGVGPTPPKTTAIVCGGSSCDAATQECCITVGGGGGGGSSSTAGGPGGDPPSTAMCTPIGKCGGDIALSCSSTASCASGQTCCADLNTDAPTAVCQASCGGGGGGNVQLCASDKECPTGRICQDTRAGFKFCRRPGGGGGGGGGGSSGGP